jgi:hypothetical protein
MIARALPHVLEFAGLGAERTIILPAHDPGVPKRLATLCS